MSEWVKALVLCYFCGMSWGVGLCSVLQGGRCPENIGLLCFHHKEPSSNGTLDFFIFFRILATLRSVSS